jgi:hypothetical protein
MLAAANRRLLPSPQNVVRNLAGLKSHSPVGYLADIPSNSKAARAFCDLRAFALRSLDREFLTAIRPTDPEPAYMLDAGIDVIGYAAFVLSKDKSDYEGIRENLGALHHYLLSTPKPDIRNYDLQAFLVVLCAARETMPALAAATGALEPLLTEDRIFAIAGRRDREYTRLIRRMYNERQQFARFFGQSSDFNEVVARFVPLLMQEPDEIVLSYREMIEKIRAARGSASQAQLAATDQDKKPRKARKRRASDTRRKIERTKLPKLTYYRSAAAATTDRLTGAREFSKWPVVPVTIKDLYAYHGRELAKAQRAWLWHARETWADKSTMCWTATDEGGIVRGYLPQKVIDPFGSPPEVKLTEEVQEERQTIATILINLSCSMHDHERYKLAFMIADRFGDLLEKGGIPTEIIGHTTTRETIPNVAGRDRSILYVLFKSPEEPHNLSIVQRLCAILHTEMHSLSYDGEALLWCHDRLKKSRAKRRLMFAITDGSASGTYIGRKGHHVRHLATRHFRDVISCLEAEEKVEIIGISLKADVSGFFNRSIRLDSIEDIYRKLSPFTLDLLRELNERKKPTAKARASFGNGDPPGCPAQVL